MSIIFIECFALNEIIWLTTIIINVIKCKVNDILNL